jgi:nucleoside-diphosphate-sugar epimerase
MDEVQYTFETDGVKTFKVNQETKERVFVGNLSRREPQGKCALVLGAGGFIGSHLVSRLKNEGYWVRGVDLKCPEFSKSTADDFIVGDLRHFQVMDEVMSDFIDEVYQLAADMGGAGFIFTGDHDSEVMHNSCLVNLNTLDAMCRKGVNKVFYSSSACIYPEAIQTSPDNPGLKEVMAYPAGPDSEYGWEKLFSERLYFAYARNHNLEVHVARFHNIFGPEGTWEGGREKAPAAMCRKALLAPDGGSMEMWGDGEQTRSFLYIDECIEAVRRFMESSFSGPLNIGSDEMVTINTLAYMAIDLSKKQVEVVHVDGPLGVRGRNSDNELIEKELSWRPTQPLIAGMERTFAWIRDQVSAQITTQ